MENPLTRSKMNIFAVALRSRDEGNGTSWKNNRNVGGFEKFTPRIPAYTSNTSVLIFIFSPEASSGVFLRLRHERNDHKRNRKRKEKDSKEIRNKKGKINKRSIWRYFRLIKTCILCINIFINIIIIIIYIESNKIFKYYFPIFSCL